MIDLLIDEIKASGFKYHKTIAELEQKKNEVFNAIQQPAELAELVKLFTNDESLKAFRVEANKLDFLAKNLNVNMDILTKAYHYAKVLYEAGMYTEAYPILHGLIVTFSQKTATGGYPSFYEGALWGRLACAVYMKFSSNTEYIQVIQGVKNFIESNLNPRKNNPSELLKQRSWLLHWSLFIFFSPSIQNPASTTITSPTARCEYLLDLFMDRNYLTTIENYCPWLLRYIVVALILSPNKRKNYLKDLLNEINLFSYSYNDKILTFFSDVYNNFNLESSYKLLLECKNILQIDFFCSIFEGPFYLQARQFILEMYCIIHHDVSLEAITTFLELNADDLEPWALELVNSTKNNSTTTSINYELSNRICYLNTVALPKKYPTESHRELVGKIASIKSLSGEIFTEQGLFIRSKNKA